jgi:hypothetical protein
MKITDLFTGGKSNSMKTTTPSLSSLYPKPATTPVVIPEKIKPVQYHLKDRGVQISEEDLNAMRPLLYGEISNRTPDKQSLESDVIFNTAVNRAKAYAARGQNKALAEIVAMPNQYQAYGGAQYQEYYNPSNPVSLAKKKQVDLMVDGIRDRINKGQFVDNTQGAYYYIHNKDGTIQYDNGRPLFAK